MTAWSAPFQEPRASLGGVAGRRHVAAGSISALCLPDAGRALTGHDDKALRLWDLEAGRLLGTLEGHGEAVRAVCASPDGRTALSAAADGAIKRWDLVLGKSLGLLSGHEGPVNAVCALFDGRRALSAGDDGTIRIWDLATGGHSVLKAEQGRLLSLSVSADGRWALTAGEKKSVKLWKIDGGVRICTLSGHAAAVRAACLSQNGYRAVTAAEDGTLKLWDARIGRCIRTFQTQGAAAALCLEPQARFAFLAGAEDFVTVWDLERGEGVWTVEGHSGAVKALAVTTDGKRLVSAAADGLRAWELDWGDAVEGRRQAEPAAAAPQPAVARQPVAIEQPVDVQPSLETAEPPARARHLLIGGVIAGLLGVTAVALKLTGRTGKQAEGRRPSGSDSAQAAERARKSEAGKKTDIRWAAIPGGAFMMGDDADEFGQAKPVHRVKLGAFELSETEVTNAQYRACEAAGACTPAHYSDGSCVAQGGKGVRASGVLPASFQGDDHPVVCVDWRQAREYAAWAGGRLPSEAEWEYAARSGGQDIRHPWGEEPATCDKAVMSEPAGPGCGKDETWPVCSKTAGNTSEGLCDMVGNVWEWMQDARHDSYVGAPSDGGAWDGPEGSLRAVRSSWWGMGDTWTPVTGRSTAFAEGMAAKFIGFRVARGGEQPRASQPPAAQAPLAARPAPPVPIPSAPKPRSLELLQRANREEPLEDGTTLADEIGLQWIKLPGGSFMMGSENGGPDERPVHPVSVNPFEMTRSPITNRQYQACVDDGGCKEIVSCSDPKFRGDDQPAICASWQEAQAFARWAGGRLATEAEWEYAARSGGLDQPYPWGSEAPTCERAVLFDEAGGCGRDATWPVCAKAAGNTRQGLCDMAGNVDEWVEDWYHDTYVGAPQDGSAWDSPPGPNHVLRGGAWKGPREGLRATARFNSGPGLVSGDWIGFRLVR